jgi:uncharacterized protein (TIGR02284 family)
MKGASKMANESAVAILNRLIETCKDGEQGFQTAAEGIKDPQTRSLFLDYSRQRAQMARALQDEVRRLGGDPERAGSVSGTVHRGWMNMRAAVTGRDEAAIIAEAERGEDVAKKTFEEAVREPLPPTALALVQQQSAMVREAHDRVRALERVTK